VFGDNRRAGTRFAPTDPWFCSCPRSQQAGRAGSADRPCRTRVGGGGYAPPWAFAGRVPRCHSTVAVTTGARALGGPNDAGRYGRRGLPIAIRSHRGKGLPIYPGRSYMCRHGAETGSATAARASRSATHAIARRVGRGLSVSPELPGLGLLARRAKDDVPAAAGRGIQSGAPDVLSYGEMLNPMASVLGLRDRPRVTVRVISLWLSSLWIGLVRAVDAGWRGPRRWTRRADGRPPGSVS